MEAAMRSAGRPVQLTELTGEDHNLQDEKSRAAALAAATAFLTAYNPPGPQSP
jgi:dipeptidyl aminopeptidase/acylaminoacyl peptidase